MYRLIRKLKKRFSTTSREINPEDIFIDSANLPGLNRDRLEGRIEQPIGDRTFFTFKVFILIVFVFLGGKLLGLQVVSGDTYKEISEENRLSRTIIFSDRGVIYDRNGVPIAYNSTRDEQDEFAKREYADIEGLSAVVGYVKYPLKDKLNRYYDELYHGQTGVEKFYDLVLGGINGSKLIEMDALGSITSESLVDSPVKGKDLYLSLDALLTEKLHNTISATASDRGFTGGAGVIMDVLTGEVLALTSYPDYDQSVVTEGQNKVEIERLLKNKYTPFLNRAISGLYTPGSIVKPIVALGALNEGVISPTKEILSTGALTLPNPYNPENPSIFRDWKAHGFVDMRKALAMSSDVYFYEIGGGFGNQKGLGITKLDDYFSLFGMGEKTGIDLPAEEESYIATPSWKAENFPDDPDWRIGNTYHTAIGQYGTQTTPIAMTRAIAAIANGGKLLTPTILLNSRSEASRVAREIDVNEEFYKIVQEGMRQAVTAGTASGLSIEGVRVAAKTGTAELGVKKDNVNSWVVGFFPYESPRFAFTVIMERGPVTNTIGGVYVMRQVLDWMVENTPEYLK
jgi:Cell division protein FtsI/penicillin-binding protein 2